MRPLLAAALVALLAGCADAPGDAPTIPTEGRDPDGSIDETISIQHEGFALPNFGGPERMLARVTLDVVDGGPIDAWVATMAHCAMYGQRGFEAEAEQLAFTNVTFEVTLPRGDHCLVLDNAGFAKGKAAPSGDVDVRYRIDVWLLGA